VLVFGRQRALGIFVSLVAAAGLVSHIAVGLGRHPPRAPRDAAIAHPNLLVITTDDQTVAQFNPVAMPFTWRFFKENGSRLTNSLSDPPLCCPARAGFLTGQYAHNHGVLTNDVGYTHLRQKEDILPEWMRHAGYRTGLVGKYLNGYPALGPTPAPGWDRFFAAGGLEIAYRNFDVGDNGTPRHYGGDRYSTSVYTQAAERFIQSSARRGDPFFLWLTYNAPHTVPDGVSPCAGARAQPQTRADYRRVAHIPLPPSPALHESNLSDKGRWVESHTRIDGARLSEVERNYRCALSTLPPVDRGIRSVVGELRRLGQLDRTIVVFTSDNGYFYGEHGIPGDKKLPYDPALRVPLAIAVPPELSGHPAPPLISSLVSNVDLAPTLLDYAHARPCKNAHRCRTVDGRSLRPLLAGRTPDWAKNRALPIELGEDFTYTALRTPRLLYMRLTADRLGRLQHPAIELYDLRTDLFELHNLWSTIRAANRDRERRLAGRLHRLTHCAGTRGPRACP
jgi:N-acetylglucosamine-6-sulfatase